MSSNRDPAEAMQAQMRDDLRQAMRARSASEVAVLRTCLAAIDNAQATPVGDMHQTYEAKPFGDRSVEVPRLLLDEPAVRAVLTREMEDRLGAAAEFERRGSDERAASLRTEAAIIRRYL